MKTRKLIQDRLERTNLLIEDALLSSKPQRIHFDQKNAKEMTEKVRFLVKDQLDLFYSAPKNVKNKSIARSSVASRLASLRRLIRSRPEFGAGLSSVFGGNLNPNSPEAGKLIEELINFSKKNSGNTRKKT